MMDLLLGHDAAVRLVACLVSSLWQGTLIALAASVLRLVLPPSAAVRYWLAVTALVVMLAVPVLSFVAGASQSVASLSPTGVDGGVWAPLAATLTATPFAASATSAWTRWIALAWLSGVSLCLLRLVIGWGATRTLLARARAPVPAWLERVFAELCRTLDVRGRVQLVLGEGSGAPAVVGWLRPVVWLPLVAVTGLSPEQLRAVLAHELAHIRRYDFVVNLLQRCIEALLFYHPAVWLVSATIRAEREHCCDEAALAVCGDRLTYAAALVELEIARSTPPQLAMAATGGDLARRVRRVLGRDAHRRDWRDAIAACTLTVALLVMAACQTTPLAAQSSAAESPTPPSAPEAATAQAAPAPQPPAPAVPAAVPSAPHAAGAPAPAAPPLQKAATDTWYFGQERPWALFYRDRTMYGGTNDDRRTARAAHDSLGRDLLWFRDNGVAYVITDDAALRRVLALFAPLDDLGKQQRALGEQQRQLGQKQRQLGEQERALGEQQRTAVASVPDLNPRLDQLRQSVAQLRLAPQASPQDVRQLQASLVSLQGELGRLQREIGARRGQIGRQQGEIGREQGELGRQQGELGRQQGELGRQQAQAARNAERQLSALLQKLVASGVAKRALGDQ